jgi:DNA-binding NtrC family response regulator
MTDPLDQPRLLVVDDDDTFRAIMERELLKRGYTPTGADGVQTAYQALARGRFDVALVDLKLTDGDGLDVVSAIRRDSPSTAVIVLTGHGTIDTAIEAMRRGAFDYLRKPCSFGELDLAFGKALEHRRLVRQNTILRDGLAPPDLGPTFVGASASFAEIRQLIERVAQTDSSVLILGETGVGKDIVAKLIHARSARRRNPLVVVQCATLHGELLGNELFGHERGAYTGAAGLKHGLFEVADSGTLFLDEIGDVSLETQVKLLRVIEAGRFRRVGATEEIAVDVRIVSATNRDLKAMMERSLFRTDLFYRLNAIRIEIPPLRERTEDIPVLVAHFMDQLGERFGQRRRVSDRALARLQEYAWPGNVRQLRHTLEHAVVLSDSDVIDVAQLPEEIRRPGAQPNPRIRTLAEVEADHIQRVLRAVGGNRTRAAKLLGISGRTLYRKLLP